MRLRIKERRLAANKTQEQVATAVGMSQSYYAQIEGGARPLKAVVQQKIAEALGCAPAELIDWDAPSESDEDMILALFREMDEEERAKWAEMGKFLRRSG